MSPSQRLLKRLLDLLGALVGLTICSWLILACWLLATIDTRRNGFFLQQRVGRHGRLFRVIKIRSMREVENIATTVTAGNDVRITKLGAFFRNTKLDELPQLWNVLIGQMSFVGPRPDVPGYADQLRGSNAKLLHLRPGITGLASVVLRNEEELLNQQGDPQGYNDEVLWPAKVQMNLRYLEAYSLRLDFLIVLATLLSHFTPRLEPLVDGLLPE
ncbi:MAG: sugar transferase [Planctomycetes bacterium]|nr:sugar transferase [Planctomycetota bacterium]